MTPKVSEIHTASCSVLNMIVKKMTNIQKCLLDRFQYFLNTGKDGILLYQSISNNGILPILPAETETEAPQATEDGMELEEPSKETPEPPVPEEPELPSEFDKLFKGCEDNPEDFNGWVYLLQYVEQEVSLSMFILLIYRFKGMKSNE